MQDSPLIIGSRTFQSRLLVGTGKYKDLNETDLAIQASGAEIVTVAIRRVNIGQHADQPNLLFHLRNTQFCQIQQAVLMQIARFVPVC
jgi:thiazole synthase